MEPIWGRQVPGGPQVSPTNRAIGVAIMAFFFMTFDHHIVILDVWKAGEQEPADISYIHIWSQAIVQKLNISNQGMLPIYLDYDVGTILPMVSWVVYSQANTARLLKCVWNSFKTKMK